MTEQEFTVRIPPRNEKKNYHIMKFNASMNVDVGKWSQVSTTKIEEFSVLQFIWYYSLKFGLFSPKNLQSLIMD